jgi:hypothetical protein
MIPYIIALIMCLSLLRISMSLTYKLKIKLLSFIINTLRSLNSGVSLSDFKPLVALIYYSLLNYFSSYSKFNS